MGAMLLRLAPINRAHRAHSRSYKSGFIATQAA